MPPPDVGVPDGLGGGAEGLGTRTGGKGGAGNLKKKKEKVEQELFHTAPLSGASFVVAEGGAAAFRVAVGRSTRARAGAPHRGDFPRACFCARPRPCRPCSRRAGPSSAPRAAGRGAAASPRRRRPRPGTGEKLGKCASTSISEPGADGRFPRQCSKRIVEIWGTRKTGRRGAGPLVVVFPRGAAGP